jgi:hypothetical protein
MDSSSGRKETTGDGLNGTTMKKADNETRRDFLEESTCRQTPFVFDALSGLGEAAPAQPSNHHGELGTSFRDTSLRMGKTAAHKYAMTQPQTHQNASKQEEPTTDDQHQARSSSSSSSSSTLMMGGRKHVASRVISDRSLPLKKRPTTPVPVPTAPIASITSTGFHFPLAQHQPTPFLRETSSSFSAYSAQNSHHAAMMVPPTLLRLTSSRGQQLMSEPLLETPSSSIALHWTQSGSSLLGGRQVSSSTMHSSRATPAGGGMRDFFTPGHEMSGQRFAINYASAAGTDYSLASDTTSSAAQHEQRGLSTSRTNATDSRPFGILGLTPSIQAQQLGFHRYNLSHLYHRPAAGQIQMTPFATTTTGLAAPLPVVAGQKNNDARATTGSTVYGKENMYHFNPPPPPPPPATTNQQPGGREQLYQDSCSTERGCKCSNSRCLKLYCDCFSHGLLCDELLCKCKSCLNNNENNEVRGPRLIAIKKILARRPDAFGIRIKKSTKGCGCKKSG